jgi:GNAT superfamily N-acetyltransferase
MKIFEVLQSEYFISTDKSKLNIGFVHHYLSKESYWAKNIPIETVQKSVDGSCCFGLYVKENFLTNQIGFARVITDFATFGYLADVFIIETYRRKGLAKWLLEVIFKHPELNGFRRWLLATKDAHDLYAQFGFLPLDKPERMMGFKPFTEYPEINS